uniref:Uncharacterized protein n=1 Tax=Anguilla anguilla TaxID=7936 RepID=A0A0E9Y1U4_ANGAN
MNKVNRFYIKNITHIEDKLVQRNCSGLLCSLTNSSRK